MNEDGRVPRRLCLIGNSHLVSLQEALAPGPERWPLRCTFVPFRGDAVMTTRIDGGVLRPTAPKARRQMRHYAGVEAVDLAAFDAIAVVGFSLKLQHALDLWRDARWCGLPSLATVADLADMGPTLVSWEAAVAALSGQLAGLTGFALAGRIAAAVDRPVLLIGQPRLHAAAQSGPVGRRFGIPRAIGMGDAAAISALFVAAADRAAAQSGARVLHQPVRTVMDDILTDPAYMAGQIDVTQGGQRIRRDDLKHPNAAYGALMLDALTLAVAAAVAA